VLLTLASVNWVAGVGCGGSGEGGNAGHGGGGGGGSTAGSGGAGTTGSGGSTGAAGAAGTTGTAGSGGSTGTGGSGGSTGAAGSGGSTGAAGTTDGGAGTGDGAAGHDASPDASDPFPDLVIPSAIAAPSGTTLKFRAHATGSQIYTCTAMAAATDGGTDGGADAGATTYAWVLKAPDAKLFDANDVQLATHFAGPTWMANDGSDVVGTKVAQASPSADAIPWLLLKAASHMGSGVMMDVTYVQRLNTKQGLAPATGCDATKVNMDTSVAYTADYYFYTGGVTTTDGGTSADWPFVTVAIPDGIATPAGTTLKTKLHGWGDQIYTCTASGGADAGADAGATTYTWVLKAPAASLYDETNTKKGAHSAGPTWTSTDGSSIVGTKLAQADSTLGDAIPWLLLKVASHAGTTGAFTDVTYVQRVNTAKGKAPATGCDAAHVNTDVNVWYSADYYFSTGDATDGGAGN
jgi:hypothetical protein